MTFKKMLENIMEKLPNMFKSMAQSRSPEDVFHTYRDQDFPPVRRAAFNEDLVKAMGNYSSSYFFMGALAQVISMAVFAEELERLGHKPLSAPDLSKVVLEAMAALYLKNEKAFEEKETDYSPSRRLLSEVQSILEGSKSFLNVDACMCGKCRAKKASKDPASIFEESMEGKKEEDTERVPEEVISSIFAKMIGIKPEDIKFFKFKKDEIPQEVKDIIDAEIDKAVEENKKRNQAENN